MIRRLLIANRGEIAVRVARTCREMGISALGVYSDIDRSARHVEAMDEAYRIGPAPATESYLRQDGIIGTALANGADAIHPGYGFLSENAGFAEAVVEAGLTWVGPPASAIAAMGSKTSARRLMQSAGVAVVPGSDGPLATSSEAHQFGEVHGYPMLLKAAAGGGGKGMRAVHASEDLDRTFESAQREALSAFGDGTLYAEKYLDRPRHIEIQIFADQHGNVIHIGERECSLQRRHQKIIEESPSAVVTPELRQRMGEMAVAAARACGYVNAGTVEMLLDTDGKFYFLEMNTRLQVEHPVTEEVTGIDLVRFQLLAASGAPLPYAQADIKHRGHAIEVRIYAEDVAGGFLPSTGKLTRLRSPSGPGVREDSGMREGSEISRFYDPMISKLIVRGESRSAARQRMLRALEEYEIGGVRTNIPFCRHIIASDKFIRGDFHTRTVESEFVDSFAAENSLPSTDDELIAVGLAHVLGTPETPLMAHHRGTFSNDGTWVRSGRESAMRELRK